MPSAQQQLKQGLLLHLETNRNFVEQKIYKQFAVQCLQEHELKKINIQKMKQTIQFIFDFGGNEEMKPFYQKLDINIKKFIQEQQEKLSPKSDEKVCMELDNLIEMIIFCVNNGFDKKPQKKPEVPSEPVQKKIAKPKTPKKKDKKPEPEPQKQKTEPKPKPQITKLNPQLQQKVGKMKLVSKPIQSVKAPAKIENKLDPSKIAKPSDFRIETHQIVKYNVVPKYLMGSISAKKQPEPEIDISVAYQVISAEDLKNQALQKVMKQRLIQIYRHYCSQQYNIGKSPTFDKLKAEMEKMTLGKFLSFCKNTKLFGKQPSYQKNNSKSIGKNELTSHFKKIAEGKLEINFDQFQTLIKNIDKKYLQMQKKKQDPQYQNEFDQPKSLPNYEARLFLQYPQKYKECKKNINMIFFTRDNQNYSNKLTISRFDKKDLTSHSGRTAKELEQDLKRRHQEQTQNKTLDLMNESRIQELTKSKKAAKKINLEQISIQQWPKIEWLQEEVQEQNMKNSNNKIFNKGRRKDVVGNLKKRVEQLSRLENH